MHNMQKKLNKKNQDRQAQALRINLLKRKEQQRARINVSVNKEQESIYYHQTDRGFLVNVRLTPNAQRDEILGVYTAPEGQAYLKVSVRALPEDDQANISLIDFIASTLRFPKTRIVLVKGEASRFKTLLFQESDAQILSQKFESLIN